MIKANAHKYSVSAMCRVLQVNRSTYYYEAAAKKDESELTADIQEIFRKSRNHYGTRKIKKELADCGKQVIKTQDWTDYETGKVWYQAILQHSLNRKKTDVMNQK